MQEVVYRCQEIFSQVMALLLTSSHLCVSIYTLLSFTTFWTELDFGSFPLYRGLYEKKNPLWFHSNVSFEGKTRERKWKDILGCIIKFQVM